MLISLNDDDNIHNNNTTTKTKMTSTTPKPQSGQYQILFPPFMPKAYHPNMTPMVKILNTLNDDTTTTNTTERSENHEFLALSNEVLKLKESNSSPLQRLESNIEKDCGKYLQKMNQHIHLFKLAHEAKEEGKLAEYKIKSVLDDMNYRYCLAKEVCPHRMEAMEKCWDSFNSIQHVPKALVGTGNEDAVCGSEKKAVERCCGQIVQSLTRKMMDREPIR